jgi:oxygen-dependent protoporphyrinogen oxidase
MPDRVIVIGGGMAGLATAYQLSRNGVPFVVLERRDRAGGVVLSEQIDGFTVDGGPDALLVQKPEGIALCRELGLGDRLVPTRPPRLAYIQRGGRLYALPAASVLGIPTRVGPFVTSRLFSIPGKLRMGAELFVPPRRDPGDESIGAFMSRRFGREAAAYLAEPLLAGIHAGDVDRLSVQALFPRFRDAERRYGSLLKAFRHQPHGPSRPTPSGGAPSGAGEGAFRSLPGGLSEMVRALVAALPAGSIRLQTEIARVTALRSGGFQVQTGTGEILDARAIVVSTPAYVAASLLPDIDAELASLCSEVRYASTATVALGFAREQVRHPLNGSGFVVPRVERTGILAGSWLSSKWPHRAPEGRVLLRTFIGGARDPHALEQSDAELIRVSMDALRPLLGITGEPVMTRIYRWDRASAQHEVGHLDRLAAIERRLAAHPGLYLTGSGFRGVGIPDCVADGRATAAQVTTWLAQPLSA